MKSDNQREAKDSCKVCFGGGSYALVKGPQPCRKCDGTGLSRRSDTEPVWHPGPLPESDIIVDAEAEQQPQWTEQDNDHGYATKP